MNKPFLKWAGGKFKLLPQLIPIIGYPTQFIEPFSGAASVSLNIVDCPVIVINDANTDLIQTYQHLISEGNDFIDYCESYFTDGNDEVVFYRNRELFNESVDKREKSALFVYLNKHSFNGLTRYNKQGKYNVPFGKYKSVTFPRTEMINFKDVMREKNQVYMHSLDFCEMKLYQNINENTVVYFDPPYIPLSETSSFTDYHTEGFTDVDQIRLVELAKHLRSQGAKVIISNHDVERARELYCDARKIIEVDVNRSVGASSESRGKVKELIAIY